MEDCITYDEIPEDRLVVVEEGQAEYAFDARTILRCCYNRHLWVNPFTNNPLKEHIIRQVLYSTENDLTMFVCGRIVVVMHRQETVGDLYDILSEISSLFVIPQIPPDTDYDVELWTVCDELEVTVTLLDPVLTLKDYIERCTGDPNLCHVLEKLTDDFKTALKDARCGKISYFDVTSYIEHSDVLELTQGLLSKLFVS